MPRKAIDYSKTIIYKIQHQDNDELLYVGHTTDFTNRKHQHKCCCNNPNNKAYNIKVYQMIRENGGWDCFKMIEIKKFPCNDSNEASAEEDRIMGEMESNMNSYRAYTGLTIQDYKKQWNIDNFDKIKESKKQWYINNIDTKKEYDKQYYINNADKKKNETNKIVLIIQKNIENKIKIIVLKMLIKLENGKKLK